MVKIKCDINQQCLKELTSILSNLNNFHSLEVVDRASARHNFKWVKITIELLAVKGLTVMKTPEGTYN